MSDFANDLQAHLAEHREMKYQLERSGEWLKLVTLLYCVEKGLDFSRDELCDLVDAGDIRLATGSDGLSIMRRFVDEKGEGNKQLWPVVNSECARVMPAKN